MLTYAQAKDFLENVIRLPNYWESLLKSNVIEFLNLYMRHHYRYLPFQNVTMTAVPKTERRNPTEKDIVSQAFLGVGGCCMNLNYFTKILLETLGLTAFAIQGTHDGSPVPGTHCMVIVRLENGECYLVEVGGAFPILEVVPMQNLPYTVLCAGGFPFEFRLTPEGLIGRYQVIGGLYNGKYIGKTEALRTSWDLTPKKLQEYEEAMTQIFTNPTNASILRHPLMCRYFHPAEVAQAIDCPTLLKNGNDNEDDAKDLGVFVFAYKRRIVIGDKYSRRKVQDYESYEEMASDLKKYFPMLASSEVDKACETWSEYELKEIPYDYIL